MPQRIQLLLEEYIAIVKEIYGEHLNQIILYGSYARGSYKADSDIDIMILSDLSDEDLKKYNQILSYNTYDFNLDHDIDIQPMAKNVDHFQKWILNYPFYTSVNREGVILYAS